MSEDDDFPERFRKRRSPFFRGWNFTDVDAVFREMEKMMQEAFKDFSSQVPKDYVKERKLPDGSTAREFGPFVYGYSMKIGPDGKPEVQEFGNVKPSLRGPKVKEEREPLVDVIQTDGEVHVVAELPGVEKEDIQLHATDDELTICVDAPQRKYYKEIALPAKVRVNEAKSVYKNGVLEVTLPKITDEKKPKGEPLSID
jgi:HSP20 family protein